MRPILNVRLDPFVKVLPIPSQKLIRGFFYLLLDSVRKKLVAPSFCHLEFLRVQMNESIVSNEALEVNP